MLKNAFELWKENIYLGLYSGLIGGLFSGLVISILVVALRLLEQFISDILIISLYITALCILIGLIAGLLFALIAPLFIILIRAKWSREELSFFYATVTLTIILFMFSELLWIEINRPMSFVQPKILFGSVVAFIISIILALLLSFGFRFAKKRNRILSRPADYLTKRKAISILMLFVLSILIPFLYFVLYQIKRADIDDPEQLQKFASTNSDIRVLLIGLDGATWHIIKPLLQEGKLPYMAELIQRGSSGVLLSYPTVNMPFANSASQGMRSPQVWESIATSKKPMEHGIWDFKVTLIPGIKDPFLFQAPFSIYSIETKPISSNMARQKRIWEILSNLAHPSIIVGWLNTWPAMHIPKGIVISDYFPLGAKNCVYPPYVTEEAERFLYKADNIEGKEFGRFMNFDFNSNYKKLNPSSLAYQENSMVEFFRNDYARDKCWQHLSLYLWRKYKPSFMAVRYNFPDSAQHNFWKYMEPKHFPNVKEEEIHKFGHLLYQVYIMLDSYIGEYIKYIDENTIIMIISDHGFGPWIEEKFKFLPQFPGKAFHPTYSGNHRKDGIIIISGKGVKKNHRITEAAIFDITPTILWLTKLPAARDMVGKPLIGSFAEQFRRERPLKYIESYGIRKTNDRQPITSKVEKEIEERLKALGYIK